MYYVVLGIFGFIIGYAIACLEFAERKRNDILHKDLLKPRKR